MTELKIETEHVIKALEMLNEGPTDRDLSWAITKLKESTFNDADGLKLLKIAQSTVKAINILLTSDDECLDDDTLFRMKALFEGIAGYLKERGYAEAS